MSDDVNLSGGDSTYYVDAENGGPRRESQAWTYHDLRAKAETSVAWTLPVSLVAAVVVALWVLLARNRRRVRLAASRPGAQAAPATPLTEAQRLRLEDELDAL